MQGQETPRMKSNIQVNKLSVMMLYKYTYMWLLQVKPVEEKEPFIMKAILRYSRYTWGTWLVMKIFIKLTTYSMLKERDMEAEAHSWISDWGPLVNPFINFVFWPFSRLVTFFYHFNKSFWDDLYYEYILPIYILYLQHLVEPPLYIIQDTSVRFMVFFYESLLGLNFGIVVFIIMFIFAIGDIASFYCHRKMKIMFRKVNREIELETLENEKEKNLKIENKSFKPRLNFIFV